MIKIHFSKRMLLIERPVVRRVWFDESDKENKNCTLHGDDEIVEICRLTDAEDENHRHREIDKHGRKIEERAGGMSGQ